MNLLLVSTVGPGRAERRWRRPSVNQAYRFALHLCTRATLTTKEWRIDRADAPIDGVIALCMALDRCEHKPERVRLLGWV
jgi:hypothetical protein